MTPSAIDTLAALVATLLVRDVVDPVAECNHKVAGSFAGRVERRVLALLFQRYGNWNKVSQAIRGRDWGSTIQRTVARQGDPTEPLSADERAAVEELLRNAPGAWRRLLDGLEAQERSGERAAE